MHNAALPSLNFSVEDLWPPFITEPLSEGWDLRPSIHQGCHLDPFYYNTSFICTSQKTHLGSKQSFLNSVASLPVSTSIPDSPLHSHASQGEALATSPWFSFKGVLQHMLAKCTHPLHQKHFIPLLSILLTCAQLVLPFYSITIFFTAWLPRVTDGGILGLLYHHSQLCNLLIQPNDIIFPFCLNWSHTDALPCMALLLFQAAVMSWWIIYPCIII